MRIVCVHQGYELYGSDRCFVDNLRVIRESYPNARIDILLPRDGPLVQLLKPMADEVKVAPLWIIRKRRLARRLVKDLFRLPVALFRAFGVFRKSDLVYINTVTVFDYVLTARLFRSKALLHIHEAPQGMIGWILGAIVRYVAAPTIFNSEATRQAYRPAKSSTSYTVYNGIYTANAPGGCTTYDGVRQLRLLMLGRLSHGKGQDILIDACGLLAGTIRGSLDIRIVGSSFDSQLELENRMRARARRVVGPGVIRFEPFVDDPTPLFEWCDLVVVPSRVREGFGRVAAEAMAHSRASIVAAHGGLAEIVTHRKNGWHFTPGDAHALALAIEEAYANPQSVRDFGNAARIFFQQRLAGELVEKQLRQILHHLTDRQIELGKTDAYRTV